VRFYVFTHLCAFDEDGVSVDFGYAFTVRAHVNYVYFDYFVDFNWKIIKAAAAFVLGVSWSTFFGTDETSYLVYTINIVSSLKALRLAKSRKAGRLMFCRKQKKEKNCCWVFSCVFF
jgi:hypothetical protein